MSTGQTYSGDGYVATPPKTIPNKYEGLGGNNGGGAQGTFVTPEAFALALLRQGIHGGDTIGPDNPSAGPADGGGFNPAADPNAPLVLTSEGPAHHSAMGDLIAPKQELHLANGGAEGQGFFLPVVAGMAILFAGCGCGDSKSDNANQNSTPNSNSEHEAISNSSLADFFKEVIFGTSSDAGTSNSGGNSTGGTVPSGPNYKPQDTRNAYYVNPDDYTSHAGGLPFPDGKVGNNHSVPSGLGLNLDLINSVIGSNLTFGPSGLSKLDLGSMGADVGSLTDLDAIFGKFGNVEGTDLDNFGSNLKPDQDFVLDLDGNGKQDMLEWAFDTLITSGEEQQTFANFVQDSASYADMKAIFMANLAENHII
jgi:hypothetical protein